MSSCVQLLLLARVSLHELGLLCGLQVVKLTQSTCAQARPQHRTQRLTESQRASARRQTVPATRDIAWASRACWRGASNTFLPVDPLPERLLMVILRPVPTHLPPAAAIKEADHRVSATKLKLFETTTTPQLLRTP